MAWRRWITAELVIAALAVGLTKGYPCGWPGRPLHGETTPHSQLFYTGESANITCHEGYVMFGQPRRTCSADGTWDYLMPFCKPNVAYRGSTQGPPAPGAAAAAAAAADGSLGRFDSRLAVDGDMKTCSSTRRELTERWWQVRLPGRTRVDSVGLVVPPGAVLELSVFVIGLGRTPETADYQLCGNFSGPLPQAKRLFRCGHQGLVGEYVYIRDERPHRDHFTLCEVEVFQFGELRECGEPEVPAHGHVTRSDPNAAEYRCQAGYRLAGYHQRRCVRGEWTEQQPVCRKIFCDRPPPLENGFLDGTIPSLTRYSYNATVRYRCAQGFTIQGGSGVRICSISGRWTGRSPRCQPLVCPMPVAPSGMEYQLLNGTTRWHALVQYTCRDGFAPGEGSAVTARSRCEDTGRWQNVNIRCEPVPVPLTPPAPAAEVTEAAAEGARLPVAVRNGGEHQQQSMSSGVVAGLAIAAVVAIAAMIIVGIFTRKRFWQRRKRSNSAGAVPPPDDVKTYDTVYEPSYQNVPSEAPALASFRGHSGQPRGGRPIEPPYETLKARLAAGGSPDVEDTYEPVAGGRVYDDVTDDQDLTPYQSLPEPDYETLRARRGGDEGDYDLVPARGVQDCDSAQANYENCQFGSPTSALAQADVPDLLKSTAGQPGIPPEILALYAKVNKSKKSNRDSGEVLDPAAAAAAAREGDSACPSSPGSSAASSYTRNLIDKFNKLAQSEVALQADAGTPPPPGDEPVHYSQLDCPPGDGSEVRPPADDPVVYSTLRPLPPVPLSG